MKTCRTWNLSSETFKRTDGKYNPWITKRLKRCGPLEVGRCMVYHSQCTELIQVHACWLLKSRCNAEKTQSYKEAMRMCPGQQASWSPGNTQHASATGHLKGKPSHDSSSTQWVKPRVQMTTPCWVWGRHNRKCGPSRRGSSQECRLHAFKLLIWKS